jgi:hypothetical protein
LRAHQEANLLATHATSLQVPLDMLALRPIGRPFRECR